MQNLKISSGSLPDIIEIPPSKSYANRALILAAIKPGEVSLTQVPTATDVVHLIHALQAVGLKVEKKGNELKILNHFPDCSRSGAEIDVGEGGTTARFLACLLATGSQPYVLKLGVRLKERPWDEFIELIRHLGGHASLQNDRLHIQGPIIAPDRLEVDCSRTTQFASGFLLALAKSNTVVVPTHLKASVSYWEMTKTLIEHFKYQNEYTVPLDWSSASYPLAYAALKQKIEFPHLKYDAHQADAKFISILMKLNAVTDTADGLIVRPALKKADFDIEASDCLDLVPTLAFFLSHIEGIHNVHGIGNLVHKESDRLMQILLMLDKIGIRYQNNEHAMTIWGKSDLSLPSMHFELPDDHRLVMVASMFLRLHSGGTVSPASAVNKSWPDFFQLLSKF